MPKLWNETIETHRHEVREAILDATMALVAEHGPLSVTMSQIAEKTGIGRATLYKYFVDVEAILLAWHDRQIARHLEHLTKLQGHAGDPASRLHAVLEAYALIRHEHHDPELAALVHRGDHLGHAHDQLARLLAELLSQAAAAGAIRTDVAASELAVYCVHSIAAAASLPSRAAVSRLVEITLAGLRPTESSQRRRRRRKP
jgi:AcrR family transcriptional regulator